MNIDLERLRRLIDAANTVEDRRRRLNATHMRRQQDRVAAERELERLIRAWGGRAPEGSRDLVAARDALTQAKASEAEALDAYRSTPNGSGGERVLAMRCAEFVRERLGNRTPTFVIDYVEPV